MFSQNIDCGYPLEPPHSDNPYENMYSKYKFMSKHKNTPVTPLLQHIRGV